MKISLAIEQGEKLDLYMIVLRGQCISSEQGKIYKEKSVLCLNELLAKQKFAKHTLRANEGPVLILSIPFEAVKDAIDVRKARLISICSP